jgi:leader peptidase (prepilin peptidase)/N-methyltransferase
MMGILWGLLGLVVGAILNIVISRLPRRGGSFAAPLHCHECGRPLAIVDVLPLAGYLAQHGHCRYCGAVLSLRFPLVEMATALMYALAFWRFGFGVTLLTNSLYLAVLVVVFAIDWRHRLILNVVTYPIAGACLLLSLVTPGTSLQSSLLGAAVYGGTFVLFYLLAVAIYRRGDALGLGDVKLAVVLGLMLGLPRAIVAMCLGVLLGALAAAWALFAGRSGKEAIPYGTSLSAAGMFALLYGDILVAWYLLP